MCFHSEVSECFKWGDPLRCYTPNIINSKKLWRYCHVNVKAKGGCVSRVGAAVMKKSQIYYFRKHEVNDIRNTAATSNCLLTSTWQQLRNILLLNVCPRYFKKQQLRLEAHDSQQFFLLYIFSALRKIISSSTAHDLRDVVYLCIQYTMGIEVRRTGKNASAIYVYFKADYMFLFLFIPRLMCTDFSFTKVMCKL
jgi:hypothetical protein